MFGNLFGKGKNKAEEPAPEALVHPGPDADGVTRVFPQEVWDGEAGDFLRKVGMSPDDPSNVIVPQDPVQSRLDKMAQQQAESFCELNGNLPHPVLPWRMLPVDCWKGEHAEFLLQTLEMLPIELWNTMLLPKDQSGAMAYGLPVYPDAVDPSFVENGTRLIGEVRQRFEAAPASPETLMEAKSNIAGLAAVFGSHTIGEEAWKRHGEIFDATLGRAQTH